MRSTNNSPQKPPKEPPLSAAEKKTYRLVLLRRTFSYLGIGLVCSAVIGGLYGDRLHFVWALCAAGAIFVAFGWFEYLKSTDSLPVFRHKKPKKDKVPYVWRKEKQKKHHKPAFLQSAEDFEDDLTPQTTADMEIFSPRLRSKALIIARIAAGLLLIIVSFVIPQ